MATRFAQLTPETIASIQSSLERGEVRDFADLCDRMMQREPHILAPIESRLSMLSGAELSIEPALPTGDPVRDALAIPGADLMRRAVERIPAFSQRVHESLMGIPIGFAAHEIEWGEDELGATVPVQLHWLHARRFRYVDWTLRIVDTGFEYNSVGIPLEPGRWLVHEPRVIPGYPTGGALRACMWLFFFKSLAMQFWHAGAEQFAWPTPVGTLPRSSGDGARERLQEALELFTNGKATVIDEGGTVQLLESAVKDGGLNAALVASCDAGFATALLGMTDLASPARVGSYSSVVERKGATIDARVFKDERALAATYETQLFAPTMEANAHLFGGVVPPTPRASWLIPAKRTPIPVELLGAVTVDEARASIGLKPFGGEKGSALYTPAPKQTPAAQVPA